MIKSITLNASHERGLFTNKLYGHYSKDVTYNFTDGINVITGRNGSGKSVLLKIIKFNCGIENDATYPRMIQPIRISKGIFSDDGYYNMPDFIEERLLKGRGYPKSSIDWDGNMVHYLTPEWFNPSDIMKRYDTPFPKGRELFSYGNSILQLMGNQSKGEGILYLLLNLFNLPVEYEERLTQANDVWVNAANIFHDWIESMSQDGKPTLLIDELDMNLDLDNQKTYWDYLHKMTERWQVIVVSHSYFAFKREDVNHIPLNKKYFKEVRKL